MSMVNPPDHRYTFLNITFLEHEIIAVNYQDPDDPDGPVMAGHRYREINCIEGDMRERLWNTLDALCDLIDDAEQQQRHAAARRP